MKSSGWQARQYTIYLICLTYAYKPRYTALKRSKFIFIKLFHLEANVVLDKDSYIGKHVNHYRIVAEISSSSPISRTYQAEHTERKKAFVALKIFHTIHLPHQRRDLFLQEVQRYKRLKHTHLLPLLDAGIDDDVPYLVTEFVASNSLRDRLLFQPGHILPVQEAVSILTQVGQTLNYMHQRNIVHGHLKPENILLREGREVLLTDFSIAALTDTLSSKDIYAANIYPYMAPEQFAGWINKSSDQYALGCIAYELLTGHAPFSGTSFAAMQGKHANEKPAAPTQHNLLLPITFEQVILKAMEKNSADRYPTIQDFVIALQPSMSVHATKSRAIEITMPTKPVLHKPPVPTVDTTPPPRNAKPKMVRIDSTSQFEKLSPSLSISTINTASPAQDTELQQVQPDDKLQAETPSPLLQAAAVSATQLEDIEAGQPSIESNTNVDELSPALLTPTIDPAEQPEGTEPALAHDAHHQVAEISPAGSTPSADVAGLPEEHNEPEQGEVLSKTQLERPLPAVAIPSWSYSDDEQPTRKEQIAPPNVLPLAKNLRPALSKPASTKLPPGLHPPGQQNQQSSKRAWLVIGGSCLIAIIIIFGMLYPVLANSFFPKSDPRVTVPYKTQSTPTPTRGLSPSPSPTPTPKQTQLPVLAGRVTPTPTPTLSPSPSPTPTTGLSVAPATLPTGTACNQSGNNNYACTITLQLAQNHAGALKWSTSSNGISASINPAKGTLAPGEQQSLYIYVNTHCPSTGTLIILTAEGNVSVPWSC
jgi:serine/threonine protein kinase